ESVLTDLSPVSGVGVISSGNHANTVVAVLDVLSSHGGDGVDTLLAGLPHVVEARHQSVPTGRTIVGNVIHIGGILDVTIAGVRQVDLHSLVSTVGADHFDKLGAQVVADHRSVNNEDFLSVAVIGGVELHHDHVSGVVFRLVILAAAADTVNQSTDSVHVLDLGGVAGLQVGQIAVANILVDDGIIAIHVHIVVHGG